MRISDGSSDVCSSDLIEATRPEPPAMQGHRNDKHVGPALLRHVPLHMSRDQPGETLLSRIFEFERDSARHVPIKIGRASCRERVCQYVWNSVCAAFLNKKQTINS